MTELWGNKFYNNFCKFVTKEVEDKFNQVIYQWQQNLKWGSMLLDGYSSKSSWGQWGYISMQRRVDKMNSCKWLTTFYGKYVFKLHTSKSSNLTQIHVLKLFPHIWPDSLKHILFALVCTDSSYKVVLL